MTLDQDSLARLARDIPHNGDLNYVTRMRIRHEVAEQDLEALLRLERICADRAYAAWRSKFAHDDEPMQLLSEALRDPHNSSLPVALDSLYTKLDDALEPENFLAVYAGFACLNTAYHAIAREMYDQDSENGEIDIDPQHWSPCFLASLVAAGGAPWEPNTDPVARREFWQWYLLNAVPSACLQ
ncbi:hypothetical protein JDV02_003444 [Purpureocillium takamizusanense]|uniref:Immunity protein Imm5 domain-containing protein n=1 Tax=Purpureocillium takamizusanense TaxID=2060973 RepID=A0A9Q8QCE5_9HYPO|nr:uncharacterized protein JDV02_003444 [Purpureocillium takamizusanense]UNI17065.1 hypothetical protein JDV02_003444 [Purpureocillium takamizusanense]